MNVIEYTLNDIGICSTAAAGPPCLAHWLPILLKAGSTKKRVGVTGTNFREVSDTSPGCSMADHGSVGVQREAGTARRTRPLN